MELLAETTELTVIGLLLGGLTTLAGVVARLYVIQERNAKRAADAYAQLAVHLLETAHNRCAVTDCPLRREIPLPPEIRRLVTDAAATVSPDITGDRRP